METAQLIHALVSAEWTFAKTMPTIPHYHSHMRKWSDKAMFKKVAEFIFNNSTHVEKFYGKDYKYFIYGDWKYWVMDDKVEDITLINRAKKENVYQ